MELQHIDLTRLGGQRACALGNTPEFESQAVTKYFILRLNHLDALSFHSLQCLSFIWGKVMLG